VKRWWFQNSYRTEQDDLKTYYLALDLRDDPNFVEEYKSYHRPDRIWPDVLQAIKHDGVLCQEIYLAGTRMVMVLTTSDEFSFEKNVEKLRDNPAMREWEKLMWNYQQAIPAAKPGERWVMMEKIFHA
jgi:L-rhamnose mutarotase